MTPARFALVTLIAVNVLTAIIWAKFMFRGWKGYWTAVAYTFTPDIVSLFQGRLLRDWSASLKLTFWGFLNVATFMGELALLQKLGIL
jgi:hypothetical protein